MKQKYIRFFSKGIIKGEDGLLFYRDAYNKGNITPETYTKIVGAKNDLEARDIYLNSLETNENYVSNLITGQPKQLSTSMFSPLQIAVASRINTAQNNLNKLNDEYRNGDISFDKYSKLMNKEDSDYNILSSLGYFKESPVEYTTKASSLRGWNEAHNYMSDILSTVGTRNNLPDLRPKSILELSVQLVRKGDFRSNAEWEKAAKEGGFTNRLLVELYLKWLNENFNAGLAEDGAYGINTAKWNDNTYTSGINTFLKDLLSLTKEFLPEERLRVVKELTVTNNTSSNIQWHRNYGSKEMNELGFTDYAFVNGKDYMRNSNGLIFLRVPGFFGVYYLEVDSNLLPILLKETNAKSTMTEEEFNEFVQKYGNFGPWGLTRRNWNDKN